MLNERKMWLDGRWQPDCRPKRPHFDTISGHGDTSVTAVAPITEDWPLLLRPMKLLAAPDDRGLGDIIAREIGPIGGDAFKKWHKRIFGRECGCDVRQESWNRKYPLTVPGP